MLKAVTNTGPAQWVIDGLDNSPRLSGLIPAGFACHARILHPGWRLKGDDGPELGALPDAVSTPLKAILASHTPPAEECWFGVWSGWAFDYKPGVPKTQSIDTGYREWLLFTGPLEAVGFQFFLRGEITANVVWPVGRAWFLATEIDFDTTYIGGSEALIQDLLKADELDARLALPDDTVCGDASPRPAPGRC